MDTLKQCETYCTNLLPIIDDVWLQDLGTGVVVYIHHLYVVLLTQMWYPLLVEITLCWCVLVGI